MSFKTFAAIDVGSNDLSMKIFEVTARQGFKEIDFVSHIIELGSDTYKGALISNEHIEEVCSVLNGFKKKMREYDVADYRAYATSAFREAENCEFILERIRLYTDIEVKVLSNSEHRFMMYKGIAARDDEFHNITGKNTAIVDIGAGSIQISLLDKHSLVTTQNIRIGSIRIRDMISIMECKTNKISKVLEEYVGNEIETFRNLYLKDKEIKNVVAIGDEIINLIKIVPELKIKDYISQEQFEYIYRKIQDSDIHNISSKYGIPFERATLLLPSAIIYLSFFEQSQAEILWTPNIVLCDGIVADYMDGDSKYVLKKEFKEDILESAHNMAKRYRCNKIHIQNVTKLALEIFDSMDKIHGLGEKARLQLEIAAILHDCGKYINMNDGANNSYTIIMSTEIMGLSHKEREEIANIVKYNTLFLPSYEEAKDIIGEASYIIIAKVAAILRIANAMDRSHKQKIDNFTVNLKDNKLVIIADTLDDITLEAGLFESKAEFFEMVYGIKPILKQKRTL